MTRIHFSLDPTKSDAELTQLILEIAREHFDMPEVQPEDENLDSDANLEQ